MKKFKGVIIISVLFFLVVNSSYFWADNLGFYAVPITLLLGIIFVSLLLYFLKQGYLSITEKFSDKSRLLTVILMLTILVAVFLKPFGIINFEKMEGGDLLVAQREGSANCLATFKLKNRSNFTFSQFCFGSSEAHGSYALLGDTIIFKDVKPERGDSVFYSYGIIRPDTSGNGKIVGDLELYRNIADTAPYILWITLKDLPQ